MKKWIIIALLFPALCTTGQPGFNKTYGFEPDMTGNIFVNVLLDADTIVLYGSATPSSPPYLQGLHFVKMDTLGNVLYQLFYPDPDGDKFAANPNFDIIKTSDNGYALTGGALLTNFGVFVKLSHDGEIEFYKKYDPNPSLQRQLRKVHETEDGYLIAGHKTLQNGDIQVFLMKVDKQGNFLWEKTYGQPGVTEIMGSLVKIDDNHFAIGGSKSIHPGSPPYNSSNIWVKSWLIQVDSFGNIINTSESPLNVQGGMGGLKKMADGWLYGTIEFEILSQFEWGQRSKVVRTTEDISEIIWETYISKTTLRGNTTVDIKPTPDGNWVSVGQWATPHPPPPDFGPNYLGGSTFKFTPEGDSLWARLDTAFWHPDCGSENYLGGVAVLPSGSIIAAGYAITNCYPPTIRSWGWVLKISPDGCIDTLCITTDLKTEPALPGVTVYPNPTSGVVYVNGCDECEIEVFDLLGRVVQKRAYSSTPLDLSFLADGTYFIKMKVKGRIIKVGKIIKRR